MVACRWTLLPDRRHGSVPQVAEGLGCVDVDLVVPHYRRGGAAGWLHAAAEVLGPDPLVLGLPERSGVLLPPAGSGPGGVPGAVPVPAPGVLGPSRTVRLDGHGREREVPWG
jgi:hypothetical protein